MSNIITIDGPAGSGKSTVSRMLALKINFLYLDTGAMYRAVALASKRQGIDPGDEKRLGELCKSLDLHFNTGEGSSRLFLGNEDISTAIRGPEIDMLASEISAAREVREAVVSLQRKMGKGTNLIAEGRDMGTVVFPEAGHKFFLTASHETRADRRYKERLERGESVSRDRVEAELRKRDHQDETRSLSPLRPAKDAVIIDSTGLTAEEVVEEIRWQLAGSQNSKGFPLTDLLNKC
jgi:cytidylate kinase